MMESASFLACRFLKVSSPSLSICSVTLVAINILPGLLGKSWLKATLSPHACFLVSQKFFSFFSPHEAHLKNIPVQ